MTVVPSEPPAETWMFGASTLPTLTMINALPLTMAGLYLAVASTTVELLSALAGLVEGEEPSPRVPTPSVDVEPRTGTVALQLTGGALDVGRESGFTLGSVCFVKEGPVVIADPDGSIQLSATTARDRRLRAVRRQGLFGPLSHLGLPLFGVEEWQQVLASAEDRDS